MNRSVRVGDDRERDVVAAIKTTGCRLQIERGNLRALVIEIKRPRGMERVGHMLAGEHGSSAAMAEMQQRFDRA